MILALLSFSAGLNGGFVLDDKQAVTQHPVVQGRAPLVDAFKLNFWGGPLNASPPSFRPLTTLSFAADHLLFGDSALGFHMSSLFCYVALVLAAWLLARRCLGPLAAWIAISFFVVMPVHVENVSSIVGRADTLAALCMVIALLALSPTIIEGKAASAIRLVVAALALLAALFCKESAVVLPIIVGLFVEYRRRREPTLSPLKAHVSTLSLTAILGLYLGVRLHFQPSMLSYRASDDVLMGAGLVERIGYGFELLARYTGLLVAPTGLCTGRKFAEVFRPQHVSLIMILGVALLCLAGYLSWRAYRRGDFPFVLAALASGFVVSGLVLAMPESMADRFLLVPSLFLCLAIGPAALSLWSRGVGGRTLLLAALAVQVVLSCRQALTWHDDGKLLSHAVLACPDSLHNHIRYAEYLSSNDQPAEAVWHYAVASKGRLAFPYAWSHPAKQEERTLAVEERLRAMHGLLRFTVDEAAWRDHFMAFLLSQGRKREANLVASTNLERQPHGSGP